MNFQEANRRLRELAAVEEPSSAEESEFNRCLDIVYGGLKNGRIKTESGTPLSGDWHGDGLDSRTTAYSHITRANREGMSDAAAERATALLETGPLRERGAAARHISVTGDPAYLRAFQSVIADPERGHLVWDDEERRAFRRVQEMRAMALSPDASGGYMVPMALDPALINTSPGVVSVLRQLADVRTIATDSLSLVTAGSVSASFDPEASEVSDDSPTLGQPVIATHRGAAFVPFSIEVGMDAPNFTAEISKLLVDGANTLQEVKFTVGSGVGEPAGIVPGLAGTASSVVGADDVTLQASDVWRLANSVSPRWAAKSVWLGNTESLNKIASFESGNGSVLFPDPDSILRRPVHESSELPSETPLILGDIRSTFVIVDRLGSVIELVPHLIGANRRPTGQRGLYLLFRTGSAVVNPAASRILEMATP